MLSGVASLLFGTSSDEPERGHVQEVEVPTRDAELGWVVVDMPSSAGNSSNEEGRQNQHQQHSGECPPSPHPPHHHLCDLRVPVEIPEGDSSCPSDPESTGSQPQLSPISCNCSGCSSARPSDVCLSDTVHVESWVLTPPPCFTGRRKRNVGVEDSPLENLLIEHPSMSVYNSYGGDSTGEDSNESSDSDVDMEEAQASRRTLVHHAAPRRPYAVAARTGMVAHIENVKYAQRKKRFQDSKSLSKKNTMRSNRVNEFRSHGKHQQHRNRNSRPSGCMNGRIGQRKF